MNSERELRQLFHRLILQEVGALHYSFLCIVEKYLEPHPDPWGKTQTRGVLKARAVVRPKHKKVKQGGKAVELKELWEVPVCWYTIGGFTYRFPMSPGDIVLVVVSEKALDHLIVDREPAHPKIKAICRLKDAIVMPFGVRMDQDPYTPNEALDSLYIAKVDETGMPISKFIMKPDGEVKIVAPKISLITPDLNLVADDPESERLVARKGDRDNDSEENGSDALIEGSPAATCEDESTYAPGLTEPPLVTDTGVEEQPTPPDPAGNPRPNEDETEEAPEEEEEGD